MMAEPLQSLIIVDCSARKKQAKMLTKGEERVYIGRKLSRKPKNTLGVNRRCIENKVRLLSEKSSSVHSEIFLQF